MAKVIGASASAIVLPINICEYSGCISSSNYGDLDTNDHDKGSEKWSDSSGSIGLSK